MGVKEEKARFRTQLSAIRIRPEERELDSSLISDRIKSLELWEASKSVLFFAPLPDEPDVLRIIDYSKAICFPRYKANRTYEAALITGLKDLLPGNFGILEPSENCVKVDASDIDLTLVPGMAFDKDRNRLGRGRGFYDRWLMQLSGKRIGVGFDHQLVDAVPTEPHDVQLDLIAIPSRIV